MLWLLLAPILALTAPAEAPARVTRSYDLSFLLEPLPQFPARSWPTAGNVILKPVEEEEEGAGALAFEGGDEDELDAPVVPPGVGVTPGEIILLIRQNIAEDSWANRLNRMEVRNSQLVVHHVPAVQEAIASLLGTLRARRARMVRVDVAYVPVDSLPAPNDLRGACLPEGEFDRTLERAGKRGRRISLTAYNEQEVHAFTGKSTTRLVDLQINSTGVAPTVNPVVESLPMGLSLEVLPEAIPGTDWFRLDLRVCRLREAAKAAKRRTFFGDLEFLTLAEESLQTTLLLADGRSAVAGRFRESLRGRKEKEDEREFAVLARVHRVDLEVESPGRARSEEPFQLRAYDVGFLLDCFKGERPVLTADAIQDLLRQSVDPEAWRDERTRIDLGEGTRLLRVTAHPATHAKVKAFLEALTRKRARVAHVEIVELEGALADLVRLRAAARGGVLLPPGWSPDGARGLRVVFRAELSGALGSRMYARGCEARQHLAGLSLVSGGTGFSVLSVPGTIVESAGDGFELDAALQPSRNAESFLLDFDLKRCRTRFDRTATVLAAVDIGPASGAVATQDGNNEVAAAQPSRVTIPFEVDLPSQTVARCRRELAIPADRAAIVMLETGAQGVGRMVVVKARDAGLANGKEPPHLQAAAPRAVRTMRLYDLRFLSRRASGMNSLPPPPLLRSAHQTHTGESPDNEDDIRPGGPSGEDVADLIQQLIAPESWNNKRNSIAIEGDRLVVVQKPPVLDQIDRFLRRLEATAGRVLVVDLALVPPQVIDSPEGDEGGSGELPWLDAPAFERIVAAGDERGLYFSAPSAEGESVELSPAGVRMILERYDVNQTGVIPVVEPSVTPYREGGFARATVHSAPGGKWFRVDVRIGRAGLSEGSRTRIHCGAMDLPRRTRQDLAASVVVPAEKAVVLGKFSLPASEKQPDSGFPVGELAAVLRVREANLLEGPLLEEAEKLRDVPRSVNIGAILAPRREYSFTAGDEEEEGAIVFSAGKKEEGPAQESTDSDALLTLLAKRFPKEGSRKYSERFAVSGSLLFAAAGEPVDEIAGYLEILARNRYRLVSIDLWQGSLLTRELAKKGMSGVLLDDGWLEKLEAAGAVRARLVTVAGFQAALASVATRNYISDVEMVSGGTGFAIVTEADVTAGVTGAGILLDGRCTLVPGTSLAQLRIRGRHARPPVFSRKLRARVDLEGRMEGNADRRVVARAGQWIDLELPDEDIDRWEHDLTVPLGKPVVLNALPDASNPGATRVLVAVVRVVPLKEREGRK